MDAKLIAWSAVFVVLAAMLAAAFYILAFTEFPDSNRDQAFLIVGAIVAKFGDSVAWLINSSKGSSDKTALLTKGEP